MEAAAFFVLLVVIPSSLSNPLSWDHQNDDSSYSRQCADHCTASNKFSYLPDKTYHYTYEVTTSTSMHGTSDDAAKIDVTAGVKVQVISKCEMVLSLSDVVIKRSDPDSSRMETVNDWTFKMGLERNPLRFSFQDGRVENLCPAYKEDVESLNFKRGVLTAFQSSMGQLKYPETVNEIDVSGICPTKYKIQQQGWKATQIEKTKDLLGCRDRYRFITALQATPFRTLDTIQSLPLIKGDHKCTQVVSSDSYLTSSTCIESLVFRPFSKKEAGARTLTTQKLTHTDTRSSSQIRADGFSRRTGLVFEHSTADAGDDQTFYAAREKLTEICRVSYQEIRASVPELFTDMVYLMRQLTDKQLMDIFEGIIRGYICEHNKEGVWNFFYDSLPMVGTSASVQAMVELLLSGDAFGLRSQLWLKSFHFLPDPTEEMVASVKRLLTVEELFNDQLHIRSILPVSTLVSHYCKEKKACDKSREVDDILTILQNNLSPNCRSSQEDLILMSLRATGNLGFSDKLAATLNGCSQNSDLPENIRVAAVEAYRGVSCDIDRSPLMALYTDKEEDSELRIAAYLAVMKCADDDVLTQVKQQLEQEEVNQVGSFVWSHLTNLQETSSPYKQAIRYILDDEELNKAFDLDKRKYSRNYELSYFSKDFGLGGVAEGNLIWSEKSMIPRSAMLNLTVDVMGHSVNLFEVGGRVQGLESILQEVIQNSEFFKGGSEPEKTSGSKCTKQQKMKRMKDKFAVEKSDMGASIYFRLFGNDFGYKSFDDKELRSLYKNFGNDVIKSLAQGNDISWTQSALFMDSTVTLPTVAGMSLSLAVNASAAITIRAKGNMDLRKLSSKKMSAMFEVRPSGATQVSGRMGLKLGATKSGIKMVTTLHSSTAMSGSLELTNGQVLTMDLKTPKRSLDILDLRSEFFIQHDIADRSLEMNKGRQLSKRSCSSEQLLRATGYQACAEASYVKSSDADEAPYYPFTGPTTLSVSVQKKDSPSGFKFTAKHIQNDVSAIGLLSIDTPGSQVDRAINAGFSVDIVAQSAEFEVNSPWKKVFAKGSYKSTKKSKEFSGTVLYDGMEHLLNMKLDKENKKGQEKWTAALDMERPKDSQVLSQIPKKFSVSSEVVLNGQGLSSKATINTGLKPGVIDLQLDVKNTRKEKSVTAKATFDKKKAYTGTARMLHSSSKNGAVLKFEPSVLLSTPGWKPFLLAAEVDFRKDKLLKTYMTIKMEKTLKDPINMDVKITKKGSGKYKGNMKLDSQYATAKAKGNLAFKGATEFSSSVKVDYKIPLLKDKRARKNRLILSTKFKDRSIKKMRKYQISLDCVNKGNSKSSFASTLELQHKNTLSKAAMTLRPGPLGKNKKDLSRTIRAEVAVDHKINQNDTEVTYNALFIHPLKGLEYEIRGKHEHHLVKKPRLETYVLAVYGKGKSVEVRLKGNDRTRNGRLDIIGSLDLSFPKIPATKVAKMIPGQRYTISTNLKENARKEYIHTVTLKGNDDRRHYIVTRVKPLSREDPTFFEFNSKIEVHTNDKNTVTLKLARDLQNNMVGNLLYQGGAHKVDLRSNLKRASFATSWDVVHPERRVTGALESSMKTKNQFDFKFNTSMYADRDKSQKIELIWHSLMEANNDNNPASYDVQFTFTTPFEGHKIYKYHRLARVLKEYVQDRVEFIWKEPENKILYDLWARKPMTARRFEVKFNIETPFEKFRLGSIDLAHKWDGSKYLSSMVKAAYNEDNIEVSLVGSNKGNAITNSLSGSFDIQSTLPEVRHFKLKLDHEDDGRLYSSHLQYDRNGEKLYNAKLSATYLRVQYQMTVDAKLELDLPDYLPYTRSTPMIITWAHTNTLTNLNSSLAVQYTPEYNTKIVVGAKGSKAENDYALDMALTIPGERLKDVELQLRQNMNFGYHGSAFWRLNKAARGGNTLSYSYSQREIEVFFNSEDIKAKLISKYHRYPYTAILEANWPSERRVPDHTIFMEASVNNLEDLSANAKLVTPWQGAENVDASVSLKKKSKTLWDFDSRLSLGVRREISANIDIDIQGPSVNLKVDTPFEKLRTINFGFEHDGKKGNGNFDSKLFFELQPMLKKYTAELSSVHGKSKLKNRLFLDLPDTDIRSLEVNLDNTKHRRGFNTNVKVKYQRDQEINLRTKTRYNVDKFPDKTKLVLDLKTPFQPLPSLNIKTDVEKKSGKWMGDFDMKTGAAVLDKLHINFAHANDETSSATDLVITSSEIEDITAAAHLDWGKSAKANLTFMAPSVGRSSIGFVRRSESWLDFNNKIFAEYNDKELDVEIGFKHEKAETRGWLVYSLPDTKNSNLRMNFHKLGKDLTDFDVGGFVQLGRDTKPYNVSAQFALVPEEKYAVGTTLETPVTKHLSFLVKAEAAKDNTKRGTIYGKYGRRFLIDVKSSNRLSESDFEQLLQVGYRLNERSLRVGSDASAQWSDARQISSLAISYNDEVIKMDTMRTTKPIFGESGSERIDIDVSTPYENFKDVGLHFSLDSHKQGAKHEGKVQLEYMDDQEAELSFDLTTPNKERASLNAILNLPLIDYRRNKISYNHQIKRERITADAEVVVGNGQRLAADLEHKDNEFVFNLNGPLESLDYVKINGKLDKNKRRVEGEASYRLRTDPGPVVLQYDLTLKQNPVVFDLKLSNRAGKTVTLNVLHDGNNWRQFNNVIELKGKAGSLGDLRLETSWKFVSVSQFDVRSGMTSSYEGAERAELSFSANRVRGEQKGDLELSWAPNNEIFFHNSWLVDIQEESSFAKIFTSLGTPWKVIDIAKLSFQHKYDRWGLEQLVSMDYNMKSVLDANITYSLTNGRHKAAMEFRRPRPMAYSADVAGYEDFFDGKINLDWDKNSPTGRVELVSSYSDKSYGDDIDTSFKFKVNHPVRILGVDTSYKAGQNELHSSGIVTWDEERGNSFSYDLSLANRTTRYSRMLEGHWKLGVPQRSVKYKGSFSESDRRVTTESAFFWDADKNEAKKVAMLTTVENNDNFKRVGVNINIPTINKQLNLGATTKGGYGKNLVDTKAEISYSSDPSKTISVTYVISNSEPENSVNGFNYTVQWSFEHPVSGIDLMMLSHLANLNRVQSVGSDFSFVDVNGRRQSINFYTVMDNINRRFEMRASSPLKSFGVQGKARNGNQDRTLVSMILYDDDDEALRVGMVMDPRRRHMDVEFNYDPDDQSKLLSLSGGYVNDSAIKLELTSQRNVRAAAEVETLIAVTLRSSQLLHTRIHWRPYVDQEIKTYLGTKFTSFTNEAQRFTGAAVKMLGDEVKGKYTLVSEELLTELGQVFDLMEQEMDIFNGQLDSLWTTIRRFHQNNRLNIRDMGEQIDKAFQEINAGLVKLVRIYKNYYTQVTITTDKWMEKLHSYPIAQAYRGAVNEVTYSLKEAEGALEKFLDMVVTDLTRFIDEAYQGYLKLSRNIDRKLDSYTRSLHELPLYRKMVAQREVFGEEVPEWVQWYDAFYIRSQEILQNQFHDVMAREEFQHMFALANEILGQVKHYHLENSLGNALKGVSETTKNILLMEFAKLKKSIMDFRNSRIIEYDPSRGELQFQVYMPFEMKSLSEFPELHPQRYIARAQRTMKSHLESFKKLLPQSPMWKFYEDLSPSITEPHTWVPPFEASAYLIGSQHFITFDKSRFDFLSTCSHVLSRDVANDLFSVVGNYDRRATRDGIRSLCFTIDDLSFDISDDYKLQVNNKEMEMPFVTKEVKITREGDFIRVQYIYGLEVLLNPALDLYKVTVSGWFHGQVAGLLGRYDNEIHNDRITPELTQYTEVNKKSCNSNSQVVSPRPELDTSGVCSVLFNASSSPFVACFKQVDPSGFQSLCYNYLSKMGELEAARLASEQYRYVCQDHGVFTNAEEKFAPCHTEAEETDISASADVVFLVEDKKCNEWAQDAIPSMVNMINSMLENKGFSGNQFGLTGYGIDEVTVHTLHGQHFGKSRDFLKALETLRYMNMEGKVDLAKALREVSKYPFRAGVTKVLIVAPCSSCEVGLLDSGVRSLLHSQGFRVHFLQDKGYSLAGHDIFGTNKERFFTDDMPDASGLSREGKEIEGVTDDFCREVAYQTGGAVFDTAHLKKRTATQRQFVKSFSDHVALSTMKPGCLDCQCDVNTGKTLCTVCGLENSYVDYLPSLPEGFTSLNDAGYSMKNYIGAALQ